MALAYHDAALRLAASFHGKPEDDLILLPFLMLYRQAFELNLKHFVRYLAALRLRRIDPRNEELAADTVDKRLREKHGHRLAAIRDELIGHWTALSLPQPFPQSVSKVIDLFHADDPRGTALRYAGDIEVVGQRADFPALAKWLGEEYSLLNACFDWIDDLDSAAPSDV